MSKEVQIVVAAMSLALSLFLGARDVSAQARFVVEVGPRTPEAAGVLSVADRKLSDDLRAAVATDARFIGVDASGNAVLEFDRPMDEAGVMAGLSSIRSATRSSAEPYDRIVQLVVGFDGEADQLETAVGLTVVDSYRHGRFLVLESESGFSAEQLKGLVEIDSTVSIEPNYRYRIPPEPAAGPGEEVDEIGLSSIPDDYRPASLWGLRDIEAPRAWRAITSPEVIVAVLDTGIAHGHEDLEDNMWSNDDDPPNGIDDDNNGYVDDHRGYDFVNDDGDPQDGHGHGTHCAGTIGAVGDNSRGVVGVSWKLELMALKIFADDGESYAGAVKVAEAIDYAVENGARILSASFGGPNRSTIVEEAIARANDEGVLLVAAAGNAGSSNDVAPFYPASYPGRNIISVMSIDANGDRSSFSNYGGESVDLAAPGRGILSTVPGDRYGRKSGTSMATPHVAGGLALLVDHPDHRDKSIRELRRVLLNNGRTLPSLAGRCGSGATLDLSFLGVIRSGVQASHASTVAAN